MSAITKASEITAEFLANYLRLPSDVAEDETDYLDTIIGAAINAACNYTGLTADELDDYKDCVIAVLVLCQDMYDTRALYVDKDNLNKTVTTILDMHSVNLLPSTEEDEDA